MLNKCSFLWPCQVILVLSTVSSQLESFYEGGSTRLYRRFVLRTDYHCSFCLWAEYLTNISSPKLICSVFCLADVTLFLLSEDYGKSFHDISHAINNTFIKKDFGICAGPGTSQQVWRYYAVCITFIAVHPFETQVGSGVCVKAREVFLLIEHFSDSSCQIRNDNGSLSQWTTAHLLFLY